MQLPFRGYRVTPALYSDCKEFPSRKAAFIPDIRYISPLSVHCRKGFLFFMIFCLF